MEWREVAWGLAPFAAAVGFFHSSEFLLQCIYNAADIDARCASAHPSPTPSLLSLLLPLISPPVPPPVLRSSCRRKERRETCQFLRCQFLRFCGSCEILPFLKGRHLSLFSLSSPLAALLFSTEYGIAMALALIEYTAECLLFPGLKARLWPMRVGGVPLVGGGEALRKAAIVTAGPSFTHDIKTRKRSCHRLITSGVYRWVDTLITSGVYGWVGTQPHPTRCALLFPRVGLPTH